jgi:hypothetical protein
LSSAAPSGTPSSADAGSWAFVSSRVTGGQVDWVESCWRSAEIRRSIGAVEQLLSGVGAL